MLGLVLKPTYSQTRKVNCDEMLHRFSKSLGAWKSGKFMALTQRPWSINTYALPKLWYICHCIEPRAKDISSINSSLKSWLYADLLEKPAELVMHRPRFLGGLGVHHVKLKALAILIRSFIESAIIDRFDRNHYHNALYRWHVLEMTDIAKPVDSPYYSAEFYETIRKVFYGSQKPIYNMTTNDWYSELLSTRVLYE